LNAAPVSLTVQGALVRLEPLRPHHAPDLIEAGSDPSVWRYLMEHPRTLADMQGLIDRALHAERSGRELPFAIIDTASGRAVGSTRYEDILPGHRSLEIGWTWLGAPWQRTPRNTQCKLMLLTHAFETLGAVRVQMKADVRNHRSRAAIERIGAVYEGTLRRNRILPDGFLRDSAYYSIIGEEWPAVKLRLHQLAQVR
jgi:N-acetyltransferase